MEFTYYIKNIKRNHAIKTVKMCKIHFVNMQLNKRHNNVPVIGVPLRCRAVLLCYFIQLQVYISRCDRGDVQVLLQFVLLLYRLLRQRRRLHEHAVQEFDALLQVSQFVTGCSVQFVIPGLLPQRASCQSDRRRC